jgi:hypothetical protein
MLRLAETYEKVAQHVIQATGVFEERMSKTG